MTALDINVGIGELESPLALTSYSEYKTFMTCLENFIKDGSSIIDLINNFVTRNTVSDLTLDYIYRNLELKDELLDVHFNEVRNRRVLPFEDIDKDLTTLLT